MRVASMNRSESAPRKVLVIATTPLCRDGLTEMFIRIAEICREFMSVDFALGEGAEEDITAHLNEIGHVFSLPSRRKHLPQYMHALRNMIGTAHYDAVHIHGNSATMAFDLLSAAAGHAKFRVAHCHNCAPQPAWKQLTLGKMLNRLVTDPVACSQASGNMLYTKPFRVLTNGIDHSRFLYDPQRAADIRKQLGIENAFIVGHIGRFTPQKNQKRLISIFAALRKIRSDAVLLLCGGGEDEDACKQLVSDLGLNKYVIFQGIVDDPAAYYDAMDVFVMPSLFEGLPLVGVEAQASGLNCLFSDTITKEALILPCSKMLSLNESDARWAETIAVMKPHENRKEASRIVCDAGFTDLTLRKQVRQLYGAE